MARAKKTVAAVSVASTPSSANVLSSSDVLKKLANVGVAPAPKSTKPDRWELPLDDKTTVAATQWVAAKTVCDAVEARVENTKAQIVDYAVGKLAEKFFDNKNRPSNPQIVLKKDDGTPDHQFIFMLTDRFKVEFKDIPESVLPVDFFTSLFEQVGLSPENAKKITENELDFTPVTGVRSFTELLDGRFGANREWVDSTSEEKAAGSKMAALLLWDGNGAAPQPLTPAEQGIVVRRDPGVVVKAGFYDRVALYCTTVDQIKGVFSIIRPVSYPSYCKFAMNDTDTSKLNRKIAAVSDILGVGCKD